MTTDWTLALEGGPRHGDRISTPALLPFLKFTQGTEDGTTTDHYYGPTASDPATLTATYQPVDGPDEAVAQIWEQGAAAALEVVDEDFMIDYMKLHNPYRRTK